MLHKNLIDGAWHEGVSVSRNINPSDVSDDRRRICASRRGAGATGHRRRQGRVPRPGRASTPQQRADALDKVGDEILARKDELGRLLSREEGKTLPEGIGEAARAGQIFKFFAGEALRRPASWCRRSGPGSRSRSRASRWASSG